MYRRSHRKSRNGCGECKRRHVKCDETRPRCINCTTGGLSCSYATNIPDLGNFIPFDNHAITQSKSSASPPDAQNETTTSSPTPPEPYVNLLHMELCNHLSTSDQLLITRDVTTRLQLPLWFNLALENPYLMHESLACAAMHLSLTHFDLSRRPIYRHEASRLQALALASFTTTVTEITPTNMIPAFLFSAVLGIHTFSEVFTTPYPSSTTSLPSQNNNGNTDDDNKEQFLDRLVQSLRLMRGIFSILSGHWPALLTSPIAPLITRVEEPTPKPPDSIFLAFQALEARILALPNTTAFTPTHQHICAEAANKLSFVYTSQYSTYSSSGEAHPRMFTSWPITVSSAYTDLVAERNEVALVVLGYFAVLLYLCRDTWAVEGAGGRLLDVVGGLVGEEWREWLVWPRGVVLGQGVEMGEEDVMVE